MNDNLLRLAHLYEKYTNGQCTPEERTEFMTLVNGDESVDELNRLIEYDVAGNREEKILAIPKANQLFDLILQKAKKQEYHSRQVSKVFTLRRIAVAASVIFLLGLGTYFLLNNNEEKTNTSAAKAPVQNDVAPGGNKAVLTLADGSTIVLDTATNGIIAAQGATKVLMLKNGELAYDNKNATEGVVLYNTISTPRGGQYQVVLSDGTKVWLNAASSLRFPTAFTGNERNVELTGEGYFEVAKNASAPFKATVHGATIEVLGTHFNVNAYNNEAAIKTTLLEGSVQVQSIIGQQSVTIKPGQQAKIESGKLSVLANVDINEVMAWKDGFFEFENLELPAIMRQIERWYDVSVEYKKPVDKHFGGRISRNLSLSNVLRLLETGSTHFTLDANKIIVY